MWRKCLAVIKVSVCPVRFIFRNCPGFFNQTLYQRQFILSGKCRCRSHLFIPGRFCDQYHALCILYLYSKVILCSGIQVILYISQPDPLFCSTDIYHISNSGEPRFFQLTVVIHGIMSSQSQIASILCRNLFVLKPFIYFPALVNRHIGKVID